MQFLNMMNRLQTLIDLLLPSGQIIVGDAGGNAAAVTMSGDTTIDNIGAVTIADDAVTPRKTLQIMVFFVAANDANQEEKDEADFICDGTADDVQIQAALNSLPAVGGTVVLSSGTFNVNARVLETTDNIHIKGSGRESTIITSTLDAGNDAMFQFNGDDCSMTDLTLDGDDAVLTSASNNNITVFTGIRFTLENCRLFDSSDNGILFQTDCTDARVIDCEIDSAANHAINATSGSDRLFVSGCFLHDSKAGGGVWWNDTTASTDEVIISNNFFFNTFLEPINVNDCDKFIITNNILNTSGDGGIIIHDGCKDFVVSNNYITTMDKNGIGIGATAGCTHFIISNNISKNNNIDDNSFSGISVISASTDFIITNNRCYDDQSTKTQDFGIELADANNNYTITNNNLIGNDTGALNDATTGTPTRIVKDNLGATARIVLTLATGVITAKQNFIVITSETGATDTLVTINASYAGQILVLTPTSGDTITIADTGNIVLAGDADFVMEQVDDTFMCIFDGTNFLELSRSSNNA